MSGHIQSGAVRRSSKRAQFLSTTILVTLLSGPALADSLTWNPAGDPPGASTGGNGDWDTATGNWDNGVANGLSFVNGADDVTFTGTGDVISINNGGTTVNPLSLSFGADGVTINGPDALNVAGSITFTNGAFGATINAEMEGALTFNSAGTLTLTANNSANFNGSHQVGSAGTLVIDNDNALGDGTGNLAISGAATVDVTGNNLAINDISVSGNSNLSGGTVTVGGQALLLDGTLSSTLQGAGNVVTNTGTTTLNGGQISVTGTTTVSGGTLNVDATSVIGATTTVAVNGGTLANAGTIGADTTVNTGGTSIPPAPRGT